MWEAHRSQFAKPCHRNFTSAGLSASSVEKYHYHSDCHRHIRSNLILITGVLAILKYKNYGVPAKVAIIRNKVLVNDLFNFQAKRLPFLLSGMNPFTHLDKGVWNAHPKSPLFRKFFKKFLEIKKPPAPVRKQTAKHVLNVFNFQFLFLCFKHFT